MWTRTTLMIVLALAACSPDPSLDPASTRAAGERPVEQAAGAQLRRAQMQAGTEWADGVLASFCSSGRCTSDDRARPHRSLHAAESGLLLFIVPERPVESRIEITKPRGRTVLQEPLTPGTTMPVRASLRAGVYVVSLIARWDSHEAQWLFGLRVPA